MAAARPPQAAVSLEIKPETALATVGDQTINKAEMYSLLEANYGPSALTQLIDYTLLMQKAKAEGVEVKEEDVQAGCGRARQRQSASRRRAEKRRRGP